jgi:hypothetical protein
VGKNGRKKPFIRKGMGKIEKKVKRKEIKEKKGKSEGKTDRREVENG